MADPDRQRTSPFGPHSTTPAELKARLEAEGRGSPFLLYRDGDGTQVIVDLTAYGGDVTVGRQASSDIALTWDVEVSRLHAQLEHAGADWVVVDDGLSRNGSFVNGERIVGRRRLRDGDRLCFGETPMSYRSPATPEVASTVSVLSSGGAIPLTTVQQKVLIALCRPVSDSAFATPSTNKEIADEVHLSVDAVKAHLRVLFERFGLHHLPQNQKRARLAATALVQGLVSPRDF